MNSGGGAGSRGFRGKECPRDCCDILVKNVLAFCSFLKNLPEVKLESLGLISVAEEISKQALMRTVLHGY